MGIFRISADWLKGGNGRSKEKKSLSRKVSGGAESGKDSRENSEPADITANRLATAKNAHSVYRDASEAWLEREQSEREQLERERLELEKWKGLLKTLKSRFDDKDNMRMRHPGLEWAKVQAKLEKNPAKLWSLNEMEKTKGEPDVVGYENGEYIFMDCSAESPEGRRNCVYDLEGEVELRKRNLCANYKRNAVSMAEFMGVNILNEKEYREFQTKGEFDGHSWSWIETPVDKRAAGFALFGNRFDNGVDMREDNPSVHGERGGWRGVLRV